MNSRIAFAPDGATYLVGTDDADLFRSYGGVQWTKIDTVSYNSNPFLYIDSASTLFYSDGIFSTDDGDSWNRLSSSIPRYYVGVTYQGYLCWADDSIFRFTADRGLSWNETKILDTLARGNAFIHSAAGRIWLAYDSVLELSTDAGSTWIRAMNGLTHSPLQEITTDPYGHTFCIQGYFPPYYGWPTTCSIYVWNPANDTWRQLTSDTALYVFSFCANSKYLFLGTQSGVFRVRIADFNLGVSTPDAQSAEPAIAYPDPASKNFSIRFYLNESSQVNITMYDVLGNAIKRVNAGLCATGWNTVPVSQTFPAGAYTYEIEASGNTFHGRIAIQP